MAVRVIVGDCREVLPTLDAASVDAIVTDPPYALGTMRRFSEGAPATTPIGQRMARGFMGQTWDNGVAFEPDTWRAVLRVLKPAGWLVAFGGTRTWHRLACAIEDGGFEVTDSLAWLHGQGFPKGASCLKPAFEPIVLARKAGRGSVLQIDASRLAGDLTGANYGGRQDSSIGYGGTQPNGYRTEAHAAGRYPANVILDAEAAAMLDEQSGGHSVNGPATYRSEHKAVLYGGDLGHRRPGDERPGFGDIGGASRFFYTAKADTAERNHGLGSRSSHPTVKPIDLASWLCRLVTPPGGVILDPFLGSGTTAIAALGCGFSCIGIEQSAEYAEIARQRIGLFAA